MSKEKNAPEPLPWFQELDAYAPGLSIAEIQAKYGLSNVIKLASNENPLGASPLAQKAVREFAPMAFRYPQGGNPRLVKALARRHNVGENRIAIGNGSDEVIDLLIRMLAAPARHNIVCFEPCFSIYPIQARIAGIETRRQRLRKDFSFDLDALLELVDEQTRLVFLTTPDNPSGYCPSLNDVAGLAAALADKAPLALLAVDEAYMDFADEKGFSLLFNHVLPDNVAFTRTFSKSWGLAGLRLGYAVMPAPVADCFWRCRLPFSVNILVEEAALAALEDAPFREATLRAVREGRQRLASGLSELGCHVWPSAANFLMFTLPREDMSAGKCFAALLEKGVIIRRLTSYGLPGHLRVSIGNERENAIFLNVMGELLKEPEKLCQ